MNCSRFLTSAVLVSGAVFSLPAQASEDKDSQSNLASVLSNLEVHGFYEMRSGYRLRDDKYEKDMSIMENRLQIDLSSYLGKTDLKFKGDVLGDLVTERAEFDLREAYIFTRPRDFIRISTTMS